MHRIRPFIIATLCAVLLMAATPTAWAAPAQASASDHATTLAQWLHDVIVRLSPGSWIPATGERSNDTEPHVAARTATAAAAGSPAGFTVGATCIGTTTEAGCIIDPDG